MALQIPKSKYFPGLNRYMVLADYCEFTNRSAEGVRKSMSLGHVIGKSLGYNQTFIDIDATAEVVGRKNARNAQSMLAGRKTKIPQIKRA